MSARHRSPRVATYSIIGYDPAKGELGIAVQSKFLAVGSVVPWARAGVGAIATQSYANTSYGPDGLAYLASGLSPEETVQRLTERDSNVAERQLGIVDAHGRSATFTGSACMAWAGGRIGPNFAAQGNILVGQETVDALAMAFLDTAGSLAERLIAALAAAQDAGGDSRGQQSAALLVVKEGAGYGGFNDRFIDLRVDDHPQPIDELRRIFALFTLYVPRAGTVTTVPLDTALILELQQRLYKAGDYAGTLHGEYDDETRSALDRYMGRTNLEARWLDGPVIDTMVIDYMRRAIPLE